MNAIETRHLTRSFGGLKAVDDVSFEVEAGEIFGFLGPNGAGKSTIMMILTTLLGPTSGEALVGGLDVVRDPKGVRKKIGYVQQDITVDEYLTGRENLQLYARLSHMPRDVVQQSIDEMLQLVELDERQHEPVLGYSGGMRKRLDIAGGLLHMPDVLFLDEPTVGLDIQTRRKIWDYVRQIHAENNVTVFLTTHYMEEADHLCDRVGIMDRGSVVVIDRPASMKDSLGNELVSIGVRGPYYRLIAGLRGMPAMLSNVTYNESLRSITMIAANGTEAVPRIFEIASECGVTIDTINVTRPTLDDVFLHYTGHEIRDGAEQGRAGKPVRRGETGGRGWRA